MASLFNTRISDTYQGLIKTIDNAAITATLKELTDGSGNSTGISLNNAGDFKVNAIFIVNEKCVLSYHARLICVFMCVLTERFINGYLLLSIE